MTIPARNAEYKAKMNWPSDITGKGIKIAVMDYGLNHWHYKYGVQVEQTLLPDVEIIPLQVLGGGMNYVDAWQYCIDHGIKVINMSFHCSETDEREAMLAKLDEAGIIPIAAATNLEKIGFPGRSKHTICVGACNTSNSTKGPELDIETYDGWIVYNLGVKDSFLDSSAACHVISCVAGLWKQANPNGTVEQFRQFLQRNNDGGIFVFKEVLQMRKDVKIYINKPYIDAGNTRIPADVPAQIINDRTMLPVRAVATAISKLIGKDIMIDWNPYNGDGQVTLSIDDDEPPSTRLVIDPGHGGGGSQ